MKKVLVLCALASTAFAFKPFETNPHSARMGVHSASVAGQTCHGFTLNYEKLSPNSLYAGVDLTGIANQDYCLSRFEVRLGYTPDKIQETIVSPFISLGSLSKKPRFSDQQDFSSVGLGCQFNMIANNYFSVGAGVQALRMKSFKNSSDEEFYAWEVSYGMKFFPETMDIELKPYFMKMNNVNREKAFGIKTSVGYAF